MPEAEIEEEDSFTDAAAAIIQEAEIEESLCVPGFKAPGRFAQLADKADDDSAADISSAPDSSRDSTATFIGIVLVSVGSVVVSACDAGPWAVDGAATYIGPDPAPLSSYTGPRWE